MGKELLSYVIAAASGGVVVSIIDYVRKSNLIASFLQLVGGAKMILVKAEQTVVTDIKKVI